MRILSNKSRSQKKLISLVLILFIFLIISKILFLLWQIFKVTSDKRVEMVLWEEIHAEAFLMAMFWIFSSSILALRNHSIKFIAIGFVLILLYVTSGLMTFYQSQNYFYHQIILLLFLAYQLIAIILSLKFEIKDFKSIRVSP